MRLSGFQSWDMEMFFDHQMREPYLSVMTTGPDTIEAHGEDAHIIKRGSHERFCLTLEGGYQTEIRIMETRKGDVLHNDSDAAVLITEHRKEQVTELERILFIEGRIATREQQISYQREVRAKNQTFVEREHSAITFHVEYERRLFSVYMSDTPSEFNIHATILTNGMMIACQYHYVNGSKQVRAYAYDRVSIPTNGEYSVRPTMEVGVFQYDVPQKGIIGFDDSSGGKPHISVRPDYHNMGIASAMIRFAMKRENASAIASPYPEFINSDLKHLLNHLGPTVTIVDRIAVQDIEINLNL
jgi:ribosomal protein S18 acetylase RimI-like enzyme